VTGDDWKGAVLLWLAMLAVVVLVLFLAYLVAIAISSRAGSR